MKRTPSDMVLALMPEGPIAHDGVDYCYSKGERLYIDNLAQHFKEVKLISFVLREGDQAYESCIHSHFRSENITVVELPRAIGERPSVLGKAWQFMKVFILLLATVPKIDILYLFLPSYPSALGWLAGRLFRKKHIVYGADDWVQASASMFKWEELRGSTFYKVYAWLNRKMESSIVSGALFGVVAGGQLLEKYRSLGCSTYDTSPRMTLSKSDVFERKDTCLGEEILLVNVGALIHDKAQHILIEAFSGLVKTNDKLRLLIVGEGPERDALIALCERLDIKDKVDFAGYIEEEKELYTLLRESDIFVLSSVTEGFPRALYEAMAMRLPIVTTDVGGIPYLLKDGLTAQVVASGDVKAIELATNELINNPELRRSMILEASRTLDGVFEMMSSSQISDLVNEHLLSEGGVVSKPGT